MPAKLVPLAVVMVPLAAQGHLNQLLHLSRLIAARGIPVHYVAAEAHIRQARSRVHGWDPSSAAAIHFHDLPTPAFSNPAPDPNAASKFPAQLIPSLVSSMHLRQPVVELVRELAASALKLAVVYDSTLPYVVQDVPAIPNAKAYCFHSIAAFSVYSFAWEYAGKPSLTEEASIFENVPSADGCFPPEFAEVMQFQHNLPKISSGDIYNTSRVIEGAYIDLLAKEKPTGTGEIWAVGPFNPVERKQSDELCLKWLDKYSLNSVILVSFGSTCSLSDEQITEIAVGLEKSGQNFIWVIREADRGNVFQGEARRAPLPEMYQERVQGRGLILRDWAPQLEILGHVATGGFLTHCGWNSCMESISMGVPVVAWPMHSDQPRNAVLMTKVLGIGVEVAEWARGEGIIPSAAVETAVRRLMASEEGEGIRNRAAELGDAVTKSVLQGGVSTKEMDSFITHISK
ncbi:zeatin O-glucosyltransferase-like [Salvia miltiorrhiza]|uniref:zeatin O-glucosyltransferase-like n=1 Tax=Salvia miltiorrhiza TaxID=226208 RepID=UPI0025AC3045|nr:zeatin O-glucosyltransferase-like [Salvia miltiorrhiza]